MRKQQRNLVIMLHILYFNTVPEVYDLASIISGSGAAIWTAVVVARWNSTKFHTAGWMC
jgi:hypothetical protein